MKGFLIKIVLFALLIFLVDKLFIIVRNKAPEFDFDRRLEYVLEGKINKDILVFGSSRGVEDIATWSIEEKLAMDSYNLSYGGSEIEFQTFVLKQLLKNNKKPKLIIKIVDDDFELTPHDINKFRLDRLFPLVKYPIVREELIKRGEKNYLMSKLFVLHQMSLSNFKFRTPKRVNDTIKEFGNLTLKKSSKKNIDWTYGTKVKYNKNLELESKLNSFKEFEQLCLQNNIKLVLTIPPSYKVLNTEFVERINNLKSNTTNLYIYDTKNTLYESTIYFKDHTHLNSIGAELYTDDLIAFIKEEKLTIKE